MNTTVTISIPKTKARDLSRVALRYGLNLKELAQKILIELRDTMPEESFSDYREPKKLKSSVTRAFGDYKAGRYARSL